ncbi:hypothetical protein NDU88_004361 [Pleurodeles waltl]|uniref:Uncharacterized protein n=1 Tax=Pleurodeles waltl TaxID=8319 RepID=A0AAV7SIP9_PLEWA|nr:hypothetical protein NDU88_004361 [Pleurodeles waltl]
MGCVAGYLITRLRTPQNQKRCSTPAAGTTTRPVAGATQTPKTNQGTRMSGFPRGLQKTTDSARGRGGREKCRQRGAGERRRGTREQELEQRGSPEDRRPTLGKEKSYNARSPPCPRRDVADKENVSLYGPGRLGEELRVREKKDQGQE